MDRPTPLLYSFYTFYTFYSRVIAG